MDVTISIARNLSIEPGARYPEEGPKSDEEFRQTILITLKMREAIANKNHLIVVLNGTAGLGTSFLDEPFGGLIRKDRIKYNDIKCHLKLVSTEAPHYLAEVSYYLKKTLEKESN